MMTIFYEYKVWSGFYSTANIFLNSISLPSFMLPNQQDRKYNQAVKFTPFLCKAGEASLEVKRDLP